MFQDVSTISWKDTLPVEENIVVSESTFYKVSNKTGVHCNSDMEKLERMYNPIIMSKLE